MVNIYIYPQDLGFVNWQGAHLVGTQFGCPAEDVVSRPALPTGPAGHVLLAACMSAWSNYSDRKHDLGPQKVAKEGKSRLKYYNLARYFCLLIVFSTNELSKGWLRVPIMWFQENRCQKKQWRNDSMIFNLRSKMPHSIHVWYITYIYHIYQ